VAGNRTSVKGFKVVSAAYEIFFSAVAYTSGDRGNSVSPSFPLCLGFASLVTVQVVFLVTVKVVEGQPNLVATEQVDG
jgi:hypothetical protein